MNKVMLIGRLTRDAQTDNVGQTTLTKFGIAVTRQFKKGEADFINCQAWGKTGEIIQQYLKKGDPIAITGNLRTGSYEKEGTKIFTSDVVVESFDFIGGKDNGGNQNSSNGGYGASKTDYSASSNNSFGGANFEEDITPVDDGDMPF